MKLHKKVVPYVLAVAPFAMASCGDVTSETGVILKIDGVQCCYCDKDGDNLADYRIWISGDRGCSNCVTDYIQVGDTITFNYYGGGDITGDSYSMAYTDVKSVNNRSLEELYKIQRVNKIRAAAGQPKMR